MMPRANQNFILPTHEPSVEFRTCSLAGDGRQHNPRTGKLAEIFFKHMEGKCKKALWEK
jgi:hypothetical protein